MPDEAVLHQVDAADAVLAAQPVERARAAPPAPSRRAVHRDGIALPRTRSRRRRARRARTPASCVSRYIFGGGSAHGSSRMPPSKEMWKRLRSVEYGRSGGHRHRDVVAPGELDQRRARVRGPTRATGAITRELGRERGVGQLEAHLVVALAGGAVAHRVRPFPARDLDLGLGDERPRDRGAQQVACPRTRRWRAASGRRSRATNSSRRSTMCTPHGAGAQGLVADRDQLLALPEIGAERHDLAAVGLDQPAEDDRGVESARSTRAPPCLTDVMRRGTRSAPRGDA